MKSPDKKDLRKQAARFYALRMLEYDGLLKNKYCCWSCIKAHKRSSFTRAEFKKPVDLKVKEKFHPEKVAASSCRKAAKRYISFGGSREMSFVELRHMVANARVQRRIVDGWFDIPGNQGTESVSQSSPVFSLENMEVVYSLHIGKASDVSTPRAFRRRVSKMDLPLCPHRDTVKFEGLFFYSREPMYCVHCLTRVLLGFKSERGVRYVVLDVTPLRGFASVTDRSCVDRTVVQGTI